ncbi:hypothetical protein BcDW1_379 [Botrytis cinerea BcDW1]|uniref:F-box domain-containing protein n=1 Tax=Botryotinia fuckeliana (strain BcDW1) TaxID=1290391 RepID=M7UB79_BOTF1|nr:hypothetical protein BcDW1_379 [Botrytis cinerea BcDW1]
MSSQPRLHLLKLPTEARDQIFNYVFLEHPEWSIKVCTSNLGFTSAYYLDTKAKKIIPRSEAQPQFQVLRTCTQIYQEYRQVIWKNRSFGWNCGLEFAQVCRMSRRGLLANSLDNITSLELFVNWRGSKSYLASCSREWAKSQYDADAFGRYAMTWKALKQVKLHLFDGRENAQNSRFVYGIGSSRRGFLLPGEELDLAYCSIGFTSVLRSLDAAVNKIAFPRKIKRADGRWEKLTQILELGVKWNDYSDKYHEENWATLTAILRVCNEAFGGGELWIDGILCWKDDVEQECMKSIEDLRFFQRMQIRA